MSPHFKIAAFFMSLFVVVSAPVVYLTLERNSTASVDLAKEMSEQIGNFVDYRVSTAVNEAESLTTLTAALFAKSEMRVLQEPKLQAYFINHLRTHLDIAEMTFATANGSLISAFNLTLKSLDHQPTKALPNDTVFAIRIIDRSKEIVKELWIYKNINLKTVALEELDTTYASGSEAWYTGAVASKNVQWTNLSQEGKNWALTVSKAVFTKDRQPIGVAAVTLPLQGMLTFLNAPAINKAGKVFLVDASDNLVASLSDLENPEWTSILTAARTEMKNGKNILFHHGEELFFATATPVSVQFPAEWFVMVIAPVAEYPLNTLLPFLGAGLFVLLLASIWVYSFSRRTTGQPRQTVEKPKKVEQPKVEKYQKIEEEKVVEVTPEPQVIVPEPVAEVIEEKAPEMAPVVEMTPPVEEHQIVEAKESVSFSVKFDIPDAEFIQQIAQLIAKEQGVVDQYLEDGLSAHWEGNQPTSARAACIAAIACKNLATSLNRKNEMHIGIHFDSSHTGLGEAVNIAFGLHAVNRTYQTPIVISKKVADTIGLDFLVRPLVCEALNDQKIEIYELIDLFIDASSRDLELCNLFSEAYRAYSRDQLGSAKHGFIKIRDKLGFDHPTKLYLDKF